MYPTPSFERIRATILQEIRNLTGITATDDSDAAIRADGTASVVEGLYAQQDYIQRQLFVATADEPYLYIHAAELGLPRIGGVKASGTVTANSVSAVSIAAGSLLTDGKGLYWQVVSTTNVPANTPTAIDVIAENAGASWNFDGETLLWVSPVAGLNGTATVVSIGGGSDTEELEAWRARLLGRKQIGEFRDRKKDLESIIAGVAGVEHVYVYPKRRGLGSMDVAITAVGSPPTLPSQQLLDAAQAVLAAYAGFWADCRVFSPTEQLVPVGAIVSGVGVSLAAIEQVIRDYFAELAPAETYQAAVLSARILQQANVTDVVLTPSSNIIPTVDWMHVYWLRLGTLNVSAAP